MTGLIMASEIGKGRNDDEKTVQVNPDLQQQKRQAMQRRLTGRVSTVACLLMYSSYVGQVSTNLAGKPVSPVQPLFAAINALLWVIYGWSKPRQKDWPVIIANFPVIIFGMLTAGTAFVN